MANWITLARFPLLALVVWLLHQPAATPRLTGVALLFAGLMMDTVDGLVARARSETSLLGSVLDIAADRSYELAMWIFFAATGLVPAVIPIVVAARTALTDALRSVGVAGGAAPLAQHRTGLGRFLVQSSWMRVAYQASKVLAFCGMGLSLGNRGGTMEAVVRMIAWVAFGFCVVRGLPVLTHAAREYHRAPA